MRVRVETHTGYGGVDMPRRFFLGERCIEVAENVDQWHGPDYRYFKVKGDDGNLYILHVDDTRNEWDLTLFQSEELPVVPPASTKGKLPPSA